MLVVSGVILEIFFLETQFRHVTMCIYIYNSKRDRFRFGNYNDDGEKTNMSMFTSVFSGYYI